jgi:glycosyltransferase involved in cell wall biosynthesis
VSELPGPPLRIAVLGDFDGPHTRAWIETFVQRGHDVHAISYYTPRVEPAGVTLHTLSSARRDAASARRDGASARRDGASARSAGAPSAATRLPPNLMRLLHAWRYKRAGLRRVLDEIRPDVFHAHYAVEHGFYGATANFHPYVVSAWGSDLLIESQKPLGKLVASTALRKADLVTGNDASLVRRAVELGVPPEKAAVVHLGIERLFLDAGARSVNLSDADASAPTIISDRALEPLYNIESVLRGFASLRRDVPGARLIVAADGSRRPRLERLARQPGLDEGVSFAGHLDQASLAEALVGAQVYVSVPSSDSLALSNLEAMAAGAFPIVSDLPSMDGWVADGVNGLRLAPGDDNALAVALRRALGDAGLRRDAAIQNRQLVEARGLREPNMLLMERHYYRLAGHPIEDGAI